MLTFEDHRQLAERCMRLAKVSNQPKVAEYLRALATNYLDLAELAHTSAARSAGNVDL
jgi:hypothetical protein